MNTLSPLSSHSLLIAAFGRNHDVLLRITGGLTHEDSLIQPQPAGNCLNWVVGHIIAVRGYILELLGEEYFWSAEEAEVYLTGSPPITHDEQAHAFDKLLSDFKASQERLIRALGELSEAELTRVVNDKTVAERLESFAWHEAYHVGQTALHRRLAGKEGVTG